MESPPVGVDYREARAAFRNAAEAAGASLEAIDYPAPGPDGEPLTTDVAWIGPEDAPKVLVQVSGTHGVEGICGSAIQVEWLRRREAARLPKDTAALLIHAINPYGFAWLRRVTHEGIDLNRNWIDFDAPLPDSSAYDALAEALVPRDWSPAGRAASQAVLRAEIARVGMAAFAQAVSGGQYTHPEGLFYGGTSPCRSRITLTRILQTRLARASHVAIIDYHSGLGDPGLGELMTSEIEGSPALERARRWYGARVIPVGTAESTSARVGGDWVGAAPRLLPHSTVTAVAMEFGTVEPLHVLEALRADHWLHAYGPSAESEADAIRRHVRAAFFVDDDMWRGMLLGQALTLCRAATAGLPTKGAR